MDELGKAINELPNKNLNEGNLMVGILNLVYTIAGLVAVGMIVYAGYVFMRTEGDAGKANKARQTMLWAISGLVIVIAAAVLTNFVIFGVDKWKK